MSVTSNSSIIITWSGDVTYSQEFDDDPNPNGSGQNQLVNLSSGNNSITIPSDAVAVTIVKPDSNTVQITAKGVNGDTGIQLNLTGKDKITLGAAPTLVLNAASAVTVRLLFS